MRIQATVSQLIGLYDRGCKAVAAQGKCVKCWQTELALKSFGRMTETYTVTLPEGLWVFDIDKARELIGKRSDYELPAEYIRNAVGEHEPGHEVCLIRLAAEGKMATTAGILARVRDDADVLIDGTHRARLCMGAGVAFPVAVLTPEELAACTLAAPPVTLASIYAMESGRLAAQFSSMDADAFFGAITGVLGKISLEEVK